MKKWIIGRPDSEISRKIRTETDVSELCADVLASRGFRSGQDAAEKLSAEDLFDPFLLKDMREACDVINEAIDDFERICVYGDYDCDGITSTVMLFSYLQFMGADVTYYIPERSEGYGLNEQAVRSIAEQGTKLIITVDNGIAALKESELIYELGMKLVVTDHHQPGDEIPKAEAVIDPHRKDCPSLFKKLCGAGVVLKLIAALEGGDYTTVFDEYDELAALASVADIVELSSENRLIVSRGMRLMENSERCGINALIKLSGIKKPLDSTSLGFGLAPRINASGRFGSPKTAAKLLLTDDEQEAEALAEQLNDLNEQRKAEEDRIIEKIAESVNTDPECVKGRVMVLSGEGWHAGVIGIVAARILERFDKPAFVISIDGDEARGSARSFGNFSIFKALEYCSDLLEKFGGHLGAGGFSLKRSDIPAFKERLEKFADENFDVMPVPELRADKFILPQEITVENIGSLSLLEPFGEGNSQPVFAMLGAVITDIVPLKEGAHTKLRLRYGNMMLEALIFRRRPEEIFLKKGDKADLMVNIQLNVYMNRKGISIIVKDIRRSGIKQSSLFAAKDAYEKFVRSEPLPKAYYARICPDREELVRIYKLIASGDTDKESICMTAEGENMNYCKAAICTDIFEELGFIKTDRFTKKITFVKDAPKTPLDNSQILSKLKAMV